MTLKPIKRLCAALAMYCVPLVLLGQSFDPESVFTQGLILYRNNNFEQAKQNFMKLAAQSANNPRETIGILMLAKTHFQLKEDQKALSVARRLIDDYPTSRYIADAYYLRAGIYFQKGEYNASLDNFAYAIEFAQSAELRRLAESTATTMMDGSISQKKIENLAKSYPWDRAKPIMTIWRAHIKFKYGQTAEARHILEKFLASDPPPRYATIARQLNTQKLKADPQIRIGILQPISGYFADEAQDFLRGCAFALKRQSTDPEIALVLKDTRGDIVSTINSTFELAESDIELVITELEGSKSAATAGLLKSSGIPVIIPVSTDNNLTKISDSVFQLNNDIETRGGALAEYAIKDLYMKTFATLAPADEYGNAITDAFVNKVDQLGGTIISQQWYYPGTTDFSGQLEAIRKAGFRISVQSSTPNIDADQLDSLYTERFVRRTSGNDRYARITDISMRTIDGFFLPCYEEDLPYIASQYALYNIKSRLLGGDTWNNVELLRRQQRYVNGVIYVAGFYLSETDLDYINFTKDFRIATSKSPGIMALYGYNIMNLIIEAVKTGNRTSDQIAAYLRSTRDFEGLGTKISLQNDRRVNDTVNILQFQDGLLQRINDTD